MYHITRSSARNREEENYRSENDWVRIDFEEDHHTTSTGVWFSFFFFLFFPCFWPFCVTDVSQPCRRCIRIQKMIFPCWGHTWHVCVRVRNVSNTGTFVSMLESYLTPLSWQFRRSCASQVLICLSYNPFQQEKTSITNSPCTASPNAPQKQRNKCPQIMCNLVMKQKAKEILIHATPVYQYHIPLHMVIYGQNLI